MWRIETVTRYVVTNGQITTETPHMYLEDAQADLAEVLEGIEEINQSETEND